MSFQSADGRQCGFQWHRNLDAHTHPGYSSGLCSSFWSLERRGQLEAGVSHVKFMDWDRVYIACYSAFPSSNSPLVICFLVSLLGFRLQSLTLSPLTLHACSQVETMAAALCFATLNSLTQCQLPQAQPPAGPGSQKSTLPK